MKIILTSSLIFILSQSYCQIDSIIGHYYYSYPATAFVNDFIKLESTGRYIIRHKTDYIAPETKLVFEGQWELINDSIKLIPDNECLSFDEILQVDHSASKSGKTEIQLISKYGGAKYKQLYVKDGERTFEILSDLL